MLIQPECIPCILNMSLALMRKLDLEQDRFRMLFKRILELPSMRGLQWKITSPEAIEPIMELITSETANPDPLESDKIKMNELAEAMIPFL